jgi:hypothetical protein
MVNEALHCDYIIRPPKVYCFTAEMIAKLLKSRAACKNRSVVTVCPSNILAVECEFYRGYRRICVCSICKNDLLTRSALLEEKSMTRQANTAWRSEIKLAVAKLNVRYNM